METATLKESKTKVRVTDNGRNFIYWVSQGTPELAKRAALKKHRDRTGLGMVIGKRVIGDHPLTAEIIDPVINVDPAA